MKAKTLYVVQIKKNGRWRITYWTKQAKPVSKDAARKAMGRAKNAWPDAEYRIAEYKEK